MPIVTPGISRQSGVVNANNTEPIGERVQYFFDPDKGIPRQDDLGVVRLLERTHPISLPLGTVKTQVSTTDWAIRPTIDEPSDEHIDAAEEFEDWLDGNYNSNGDPWDHLVKKWSHDILGIDAGVIEKVPGPEGWLRELYNRDGATFTKSLNRHGQLPEPPEASYWQFQFSGSMQPFDPGRDLREMAEEYSSGVPYMQRRGDPIGFSREQIIWTETNPAPWRHYGFGKAQQAKRVAEIILNQDTSNLSYFSKNEVPDGVINVIEANQDEVDRFRDYWNEEVQGEEHVLPIVGGDGSQIDWVPFRPTPDELEFMASQKWYHQMVWMIFGLNQGEVGDIENINRSTMKEQAANVFRTTTKPLLDRLQADINRHILPYRPEYHRVNGEIEFAWQIDNPAMKARERERQDQDLENGTSTVNEIRLARGKEQLPWGDIPLELVRSVARNHPIWALENWGDVDDPPDPAPAGGLLGYGGGSEGKAERGGDLPNCRSKGGKPVGPFEDFESCVEAMLDEGYSREEAERICGAMEQEAAYYRAVMHRDDDSLRDEPFEWQYPPLSGHIDAMGEEVEREVDGFEEDLVSIAEENFPDDDSDATLIQPAIDDSLDEFSRELSEALSGVVIERNREAMEIAADYHASQLEEEAEKRFSKQDEEEVAISLSTDISDTVAYDRMRMAAGRRMTTVSETIKEMVRKTMVEVAEDNGSVSDATRELRTFLDTDIPNHSRLVARTETRLAQSDGSQALAESSDLIAGKKWNATNDNRTRAWHAEMDGVIVPKDEPFIVPRVSDNDQPGDYPREAFTVGSDQPFNCRCVQEPVLEDNMPDDVDQLDALDGISAWSIPKDSERMREVVKANANAAAGSLSDLLRTVLDDVGSRNKACESLGISTATLYDWGAAAGMAEFE